MREDFICYLWKFRKFDFLSARTQDGDPIEILHPGTENLDAGPDFFNAQVRIGQQLWAGNVEIHIKSSDWYFHKHESDPGYDNVILHVVWEDDAAVYRRDNSIIPTFCIQTCTSCKTFDSYRQLLESNHYQLNCESELPSISGFTKEHWLENLYFERLETRYEAILKILKKTGNDWEAVLFISLARSFGLKVNADAFESIASSIGFKTIRKLGGDQKKLEALFLGHGQLISGEENYALELIAEYEYLKRKFDLNNSEIIKPVFFRLRPDNFPTIRLVQLAALYSKRSGLFSQILKCKNIQDFYLLFEVGVSDFWKTHYNFGKTHKSRNKKLSKPFVNLILINSILPLLYCYYKFMGEDRNDFLYSLISELPAEENSITQIFKNLNKELSQNAMQSQALIQLKNNYCNKNLCLKCEWGVSFLQK